MVSYLTNHGASHNDSIRETRNGLGIVWGRDTEANRNRFFRSFPNGIHVFANVVQIDELGSGYSG